MARGKTKYPKFVTGPHEKAKWDELSSKYTLLEDEAIELAIDICKCTEIIVLSDNHWREKGVVLAAGKNGAPYANPSIGQRTKVATHRLKLLKLLSKYKNATGSNALEVEV